ncbi:hypothetical protein E4U41_002741 [Claviceps citrina]|nr:hypothetical protein E4U41_002741 [Claviceps citrina]
MAEQETAWNYARNEGCFSDHQGPSFHPDSHLESLKHAAFSPEADILADECGRYSYSLGSPDSDVEGGSKDELDSLLNKLEQQCKAAEVFPQLLPRWNEVYNDLAFATELMEGFNIDLDVAEYREQVRFYRHPDLAQAWLPIFSLDDRKDEGLMFPPAAQRLELLLLHELQNDRNLSRPPDAKLAHLLTEADMANESLRNLLAEPLRCLHEDLFLLPIHDVPPDVDRDGSLGSGSVISAMDPSSETNSPNVQHIESSAWTRAWTSYRHENGNETKGQSQSTPPRQGQDPTPCSPELAKGMTLPLPSSDSYGEMEMMCDKPQKYEHDIPDDWSPAECVLLTNDGVENPPQSRDTPEKATTAQDPTSTFAQSYAQLTPGDDTGAENGQQGECISTSEQGCQPEIVKEKHVDNTPRLGLERRHFGSSHLLSQFMAMTGATQRPTRSSSCSATSITSRLPRSKTKGVENTLVSRAGQRSDAAVEVCPKKLLPAISPDISAPEKTGCCLVSVQLGHSVIRHLEELWPATHLADRDFCSHFCTEKKRLHDGSSAVLESTAFQAAEVDVSLTVEDGIIVTNLLQIRQKPLPSSTALTAIRQRVCNLSQKYQRLTVLVLESPGAQDYMGELSPKDLEIYTEFVCFASSMKADIAVHLVPGGERTLSRWILSLMIKFAPQMIKLEDATTMGNTTWELFFRQTGMNVRAAQLLSRSLFEDFGTSGLTAFLTMTSTEQMLEYGKKLGIERQVARCSIVAGSWNAQGPGPKPRS